MNNNQLTRHWSTSRDQFFRPRECFIPLPNMLWDDVLPIMTGNEFKIYMILWRKSWGWNSETCTLSYDQLATAAAVSVRTAIRSIDELEGRGLVTVTRTSTRDIHSSNVYRLNPPPNITPSFEPEPAQAMTAMTAIEPEPATAGVTDTHPTHNLPGGGDTEPEPIPSAGVTDTHPTHNLPGGGMNAAAILNHLMIGYTPTHNLPGGGDTEPIPSAGLADTHPTHTSDGGGGDTEPEPTAGGEYYPRKPYPYRNHGGGGGNSESEYYPRKPYPYRNHGGDTSPPTPTPTPSPEPIPPEPIPSAGLADTHPTHTSDGGGMNAGDTSPPTPSPFTIRRRNANYPIPAGAIRPGLVPAFTHEEFLKNYKPSPPTPPLTVRPTLRKPPTPTEPAGAAVLEG